jgi:ATP-binding cassette, subfamily B, bacterial
MYRVKVNAVRPKKKLSAKQTYRAAVYAAKTVIKLRPKVFIFSLFDEMFSRTVPFVTAALSASIISALPNLVVVGAKEAALRTIMLSLVAILVVDVVRASEQNAFNYYQSKNQVELNAHINMELRRKFALLPYGKYEDKKIIDQYDLATYYAERLSSFVLYRLRSLLGSLYTIVIASIVLIRFSPILALALAVAALPQLILEFKVNKEQRKNWRETTTTRRKASTFEGLLSPAVIKDTRLFGLVEFAVQKAFHFGKQAQQEQVAIDRAADKYRLSLRVVDAVVEAGSLSYVVSLIYRGIQPIGQFVYAQQVLNQYSSGLKDMLWYLQDLDEFLAGATEFHKFMQMPEPTKGKRTINTNQGITIKNLSFTYPDAAAEALHEVSLTIPHGKTVAIVGENGAGKTTLIKLLMKLYDPTSGTIAIGKDSLEEIDEHAWHQKLGVLFQDYMSFYDFTIKENVQLGRQRKNDEQALKDAMSSAGVEDFTKSLPQGVDTYLGKYMDEENGTNLSGGQLQRLAIARVMFRDPDILIMDEPTSAIDAKAELKIFQAIERARKNKTTILISHRFSTVRRADYIFVLEAGKLSEQGTHQELMQQKGLYSELFNAQAKGYSP